MPAPDRQAPGAAKSQICRRSVGLFSLTRVPSVGGFSSKAITLCRRAFRGFVDWNFARFGPIVSGGRWRRRVVEKVGVRAQCTGDLGGRGRNAFCGTDYADTHLRLRKNFPVGEKLMAQFRFDMFNAFNRVNLQAPNNYIDSPTFMQVSSAYQPRVLQLAARLFW